MRTASTLTLVATLVTFWAGVVRAQGVRLAVVTVTALDGRPRTQSDQIRDRAAATVARCVPQTGAVSAGPTAKLRLRVGPAGTIQSIEQVGAETTGRWRTCVVRALRGLRLRAGAPATIELRATWTLVALGDVSGPPVLDSTVELHPPPPPPPPPQTRVAQVRVGTVDTEPPAYPRGQARRVVLAQRRRLLRCYEQAIRTDPTVRGTVSLELVITPRGSVGTARARLHDLRSPVLPACLEDAARSLAFAPPTGGGVARVHALVELFLGPTPP